MTRNAKAFEGPLSLEIAEGATTPSPGVDGAEIWSTTANKRLQWLGGAWVAAYAVAGHTHAEATSEAAGFLSAADFDRLQNIDLTTMVRRYESLVGDSLATSFVVTHALNTRDVVVTVYDAAAPYDEVWCDVQHTTADTVTLRFTDPPAMNAYRCVVHGAYQSGPGSGGGGSGGGTASVSTVTVDFGTMPVSSKSFVVPVTGAMLGQKVIAVPSLDMPVGVDEDELEMDMLTCAARVMAADSVKLVVASVGGSVSGQRAFNILVGSS